MKDALDWALYRSNAHRGARLVLTCLADNSNERGMVALPVNILAAMTNLSRQAVYGAIDRLLENGDLVEATRQGRSVTYRLGCFNEAGALIGAEKKEAA